MNLKMSNSNSMLLATVCVYGILFVLSGCATYEEKPEEVIQDTEEAIERSIDHSIDRKLWELEKKMREIAS
jgi:hypothetical protein